jgi:hypothetical protein
LKFSGPLVAGGPIPGCRTALTPSHMPVGCELEWMAALGANGRHIFVVSLSGFDPICEIR